MMPGTGYEYDAAGRAVTLTTATPTNLAYDGDGRQVKSAETETKKLGSGLRFFDSHYLQASSYNKPSCSSSSLGGAAKFLALTHVATSH